MEYSIEKIHDGIVVLKLVGDISAYQLQNLKDTIQKLKAESGSKKVILDLKDVGYLDAFALGIITSFSKELRDTGGDMKIVNMNNGIKLLFDLSHLSKVYETFNNIEEAAKSF